MHPMCSVRCRGFSNRILVLNVSVYTVYNIQYAYISNHTNQMDNLMFNVQAFLFLASYQVSELANK